MRRIGAGFLVACLACCLTLTITACSGKKITVAADDSTLVATASGPTPTKPQFSMKQAGDTWLIDGIHA